MLLIKESKTKDIDEEVGLFRNYELASSFVKPLSNYLRASAYSTFSLRFRT